MEKERVLIVDDDPSIREMIARIVNEIGFEGVKAVNGREAMDLLRQSSFLLMITDMKMPEMDGFELTRSARAEFPILPVICMTAHGASYTYTDVVGYGATDYITKPFTLDEMTAKLDRVIQEKNLIRDLTQKSVELEKANEDLKRLDQLKSTFISSVSHELRTPLTVIKEFISLMIEGHGGPLTDDQKEYLGITRKNILRLTNLIETLLDFSRIESGKGLKLRFEPVSLMEVIEDASMTLSTQLEERRITLGNQIDPDTPRVLVDRNRMVEVFINLIGNGIKFTPPGGKITIDSRGLTEKRDFLKVREGSLTSVGNAGEDRELHLSEPFQIFIRLLQLHRLLGQVPDEVFLPYDPVQLSRHVIKGKGLGNVVRSSKTHHIGIGIGGSMGRHADDRKSRKFRTGRSGQFETIHLRHSHIRNHQQERALPEEIHGLSSITGPHSFIPHLVYNPGDYFPDGWIIVHDEDPFLFHAVIPSYRQPHLSADPA